MFRTRPLQMLVPAVAVACVVFSSCNRSEPVPAADAGVLATVNGVPITETDVLYETGNARQHQEDTPVDREKILQTIITRELAYRKALELGFDADPGYQEELGRMESQLNRLKRKELAEVFFERQVAGKAKVSDAEAREYFRQNETTIRSETRVWQILRRDERLIEEDLGDLRQGKPFEEVAGKRFENLLQMDRQPWDLGYLRWEQVPEVWWSVIGDLEAGDTSGIIRGQGERFWIVRLVDRRQDPDTDYADVEPKIKVILKQKKMQQFREDVNHDLLEGARIVYVSNPTVVPKPAEE